jgi:hypothetical protein
MTPAEVPDAMLEAALSTVYGQPTRLDDVDPDTLDSSRLGIAAVLTLVAEEIEAGAALITIDSRAQNGMRMAARLARGRT